MNARSIATSSTALSAVLLTLNLVGSAGAQSTLLDLRPQRFCRGQREPRCPSGQLPSCVNGGWLCIRGFTPRERCNAEDDDGDGKTDEGTAAELCPARDGLACTSPTCVRTFEPSGGGPFSVLVPTGAVCRELPKDSLCEADEFECTVERCDTEAGGCVSEPSDALCDDEDPDTDDTCLSPFGALFPSGLDERGCSHHNFSYVPPGWPEF